MIESYLPIRNIEDALNFLAYREGRIDFRPLPTIDSFGLVSRVKIIGRDSIVYQSEYRHDKVSLDNDRKTSFTETIVRLAEQIRIEDAKTPVGFMWEKLP